VAISIGNLNVKVGLDPTGVATGIVKLASMLAKLSGILEDAFTKPFKALETLAGMIPYVGGLLQLPFTAARGLMGVYGEGSKKIMEIGKAAQQAGADVESFQTLMYATKLTADELAPALFKLNTKIVQAAKQADDAKNVFTDYGLSAKELLPLNPLARADMYIARFKALKDPAMQSAMAFDLFGKKGNAMLPFLNRGPEGLAKVRKMLAETGLGITNQDFKNVKDAMEFAKMIERFKDSVTMEVTKGLSPFLAEINKLFDGVNIGAKGLSEYVRRFAEGFVFAGSLGVALFEKVRGMLPTVGDFFTSLTASALEFFNAASVKANEMLDVFRALVKELQAIQKLFTLPKLPRPSELFRGTPAAPPEVIDPEAAAAAARRATEANAGMTAAARALAERSGVAFNATPRPPGYDEALAASRALAERSGQRLVEFKPELFVAAQRTLRTATEEAMTAQERLTSAFNRLGTATFGDVWANGKAKFDEFMTGVNARFKSTVDAIVGPTREMTQALYGDRIKAYEDAVKSPIEKYREEMEKLEAVYAAAKPFGLMDAATRDRQANKLFQELSKAAPDSSTKFAAAITQGSKEDYSARMAHDYGTSSNNPQARLEQVMKDILSVQEREEKNGREATEALKNLVARGI